MKRWKREAYGCYPAGVRHFLGIALVALGGCAADATQLLVVVDTDLQVGVEYDAIQITASGESGDEATRDIDASVPFSLGISPGRGPKNQRVVVTATATLAGESVVSRRVITHFVPEQTRRVDLLLARACGGVECGGDETCREGTCEDANVDAMSLPVANPADPVMPLHDGPRVAPDAGPDASEMDDASMGEDAGECQEGMECEPEGEPCRMGQVVCSPVPSCMAGAPLPEGTMCGEAGRTCDGEGMCGRLAE